MVPLRHRRAASGPGCRGRRTRSRPAGSSPGCCWSAGDWDEALALCDVRHQPAPPMARRAAGGAAGERSRSPAASTSPASSRALRRFWPREGGIAIHAAARRSALAGLARRRRAAAVAVYDDAVSVLTAHLARVVQRPDPAGRRHAGGRSPRRVARCRRPSGRRTSTAASGCTPTAARCSTGTPTRPGFWGPRAAPGCSGSTPRCCGCAGWPASTPRRWTRWSSAWREAAALLRGLR